MKLITSIHSSSLIWPAIGSQCSDARSRRARATALTCNVLWGMNLFRHHSKNILKCSNGRIFNLSFVMEIDKIRREDSIFILPYLMKKVKSGALRDKWKTFHLGIANDHILLLELELWNVL